MSGRKGDHGSGDSGMGCLIIFILALIAMPLVGLYLILSSGSDDETKVIGWVLLIAGCVFWLYVAARSGH